jgi:hypothetical protein
VLLLIVRTCLATGQFTRCQSARAGSNAENR